MAWRAALPVALLLAVAGAQVTLTRTAGLSPWKGGGFGMFSTTDDAGRRWVRVFVSAPERSEEIAIAPSLEDAAKRAAAAAERRGVLATGAAGGRTRTTAMAGPWTRSASKRGASTSRPARWRRSPTAFETSCTVWTRLLHPAPDEDGVADAVLTLTAIILLLRPLDVWWLTPFILAAACLSLLLTRRPADARSPGSWWRCWWRRGSPSCGRCRTTTSTCSPTGVWRSGWRCRVPRPATTLATSSRWLLGAAFAMAVLWKAVLSPDYVDGRFFRVTLLTDERFADAALLFGGLSAEQMIENRKFLEPLPEGAELLDPAGLRRAAAPAGVRVGGHLGRPGAGIGRRRALPDPRRPDDSWRRGTRRCSCSARRPTRWLRSPASAG